MIRQELAAGGDIVLGGDGDRKPTVRRRGAAGDPGQHLARLPDPRGGGRGDRRPRGADRRARELRHRPAGETRGQDRLRRDRPRDRPRRQRTLAGRRRRPQPARLPLLGRPRGEPAGSAARPLAALAQPRAPQGGAARAWRAWRRRSATSSTCCWSATCAASPATRPARAVPRVTRRRTIAAPAARGLGAGLRPLQPAALVAADRRGSRTSSAARAGGAASGRKVLETAEGRGVRADYRCVSSAEGERYVWEQQLEGTPFERTCAARGSRSGSRDGDGGTEVEHHLGADAARAVAARLADDAARPGRDPRRSARRDRAGADGEDMSAEPAPRLEVVGVGRPGDAPELDEAALDDAARAGRRARGRGRCAAELEDVRAAARPRQLPRRADRGGRRGATSSPRPRTACATPTGRGYVDLARLRSGRLEAAPDAVVLPADARPRCGACSRPARRRASPSSPSAAAPASSAGSSRCAATHERADQPRPRRACAGSRSTSRSLTARLGAGLRGPEAEAALGAPGPRPRPLPAVLRVRDDRRLRRDPLGRPGLERLRPLRLAGQLGPPARPGRRHAAPWRPRTPPPARRCASCRSAPRGSSA